MSNVKATKASVFSNLIDTIKSIFSDDSIENIDSLSNDEKKELNEILKIQLEERKAREQASDKKIVEKQKQKEIKKNIKENNDKKQANTKNKNIDKIR